MKGKRIFNRIASLALAVVMMFTVIGVMPADVNAATPSFKSSGKSKVTITDDNCSYMPGVDTWIKFKAKNTGYITIKAACKSDLANDTYGYITFCDKNKKALGQADELYRTDYDDAKYYTTTYGVKKGQTYYFQVYSRHGVTLTAYANSQKKAAGTKKAKAKTIKKNKTVKGVIIAGDKTVDWYKIKLTKSQKVKINYTAKSNGDTDYYGIKFTFCDSKGKAFTYNAYDRVNRVYPKSGMEFCLKNTATGKKSGLKTGTYYVKVERYNKKSSGYYTLKWK